MGYSEAQLGDTGADADWTEHDYAVTGCEGSPGEGRVTLHVDPASDIVLTLVGGKLRRGACWNPNGTHPRAQGPGGKPAVRLIFLRSTPPPRRHTRPGPAVRGAQLHIK